MAYLLLFELNITPCICAKSEAIDFVVIVVVHTKIARSRDLDVLAGGQSSKDIKNNEKVHLIKTMNAINHAFCSVQVEVKSY